MYEFKHLVTSSENTPKDAKVKMARIALQYINENYIKLGIDRNHIKSAPTPEELGITELCM